MQTSKKFYVMVHRTLSVPMKNCSKIVDVMLKNYMHGVVTLEMLDQAHLILGFLRLARARYAKSNVLA